MNALQPTSAPRFDIFEPGDKTALVCMDVPEMERIVVEQLSSIGYKIHTGISIEDLLFKMRAHHYDVLIIAENFAAATLTHHPLLQETVNAPAQQRLGQLVVLVGASFKTSDEMQAFTHSVDVVVGLADIMNLRPVVRRSVLRQQEFYGRYIEAISAADVV